MFKYLIYNFGLELADDVAPLVELGFNVSMVCLVVLFCFINVFGYLIVFYLIEYSHLDKKYPKIKGIVNYLKKSSWVFLMFELIIRFAGLIMLIYLGFSFYKLIITQY